MKNILLFGLLSVGLAAGAAGGDGSSVTSSSSGSAQESHMWGLIARGGWMLENPDRAVLSRWNHQVGDSYKYAIGGRISFPPDWQVRFLGGVEYQYITSREELSGSGKASIDITISQFVFYGGAEYMPPWAEGFGANLTGGLVLGARKSSQLDSGGFTQDLKDESPYGSSDWPVVFSLSVFYEWGNLRPILMYESDSALTLGGAYVF